MRPTRPVAKKATKLSLEDEIAHLRDLSLQGLRARWKSMFRQQPPPHLPRHLLFAILAYRLQSDALGDLDPATARLLKLRPLSNGRTIGGIPFTRGSLAAFLRNRFYIGEVQYKGEVFPGEQPAILDRALFDAVQSKLERQRTNHAKVRQQSQSLLTGRLFDDRGNRMTPSHAVKNACAIATISRQYSFRGSRIRPPSSIACLPPKSKS